MVQALIEDDKGMIWVSTEYGLSCFNPETVTFENYLFSDYILGNVYSENSVLKLQDGRLALGTGQGIVIVDPKHVSVKDTPMQVTFTDLKLNGISVIPGDKDSPLEASLAYAESVRLNYEQNSFVDIFYDDHLTVFFFEFCSLQESASRILSSSCKGKEYSWYMVG